MWTLHLLYSFNYSSFPFPYTDSMSNQLHSLECHFSFPWTTVQTAKWWNSQPIRMHCYVKWRPMKFHRGRSYIVWCHINRKEASGKISLHVILTLTCFYHTVPIYVLFLKEITTFIQQGHIKLIGSDSKGIYNVIKISTSNKCCSFVLSVDQRILKNKIYHSFHKNTRQQNCFQHW